VVVEPKSLPLAEVEDNCIFDCVCELGALAECDRDSSDVVEEELALTEFVEDPCPPDTEDCQVNS